MEGESIKSLFLHQVRKVSPAGHRRTLGPAPEGKRFAEHQQKEAKQKYLNSPNWA